VNPRTGLDDVGRRKILIPPGLELRPLGRPARSQSLYRLLYPGSTAVVENKIGNCIQNFSLKNEGYVRNKY
jgi:hypothetical protein